MLKRVYYTTLSATVGKIMIIWRLLDNGIRVMNLISLLSETEHVISLIIHDKIMSSSFIVCLLECFFKLTSKTSFTIWTSLTIKSTKYGPIYARLCTHPTSTRHIITHHYFYCRFYYVILIYNFYLNGRIISLTFWLKSLAYSGISNVTGSSLGIGTLVRKLSRGDCSLLKKSD